MSQLNEVLKLMPHKISKRIKKTAEGRSGLEIYKRRNRRNYRALMQYSTWNRIMIEKGDSFFDFFEEGYIVMITPNEYYANNYPNRSNEVNYKFILGQTGFLYYSSKDELNKYPPQSNKELVELSTQYNNEKPTWIGDIVFNIKNTDIPKISYICKTEKERTNLDKEKNEEILLNLIKEYEYVNLPKQAGIGNYDFDYASAEMIEQVKYQMFYLMTRAIRRGNDEIKKIIHINNQNLDSKNDIRLIDSIKSDEFPISFSKVFRSFENEVILKGLFDTELLQEIGALNNQNELICPLCKNVIDFEEFFIEIEQQEGRQVMDNTQRSIVLMHVKALKPGDFNHKTYNLAWGHNWCNLIQGDKDIDETIEMLKEIIDNHESRK